MPIYEYRCEKDHTFEVLQRMSDDPVTSCEVCSAPVQRVFHPVAVHFKGSGFYNTDYGKQKRSGAGSEDSGGDSKKDGDSKKPEGGSSSDGGSKAKETSSSSATATKSD